MKGWTTLFYKEVLRFWKVGFQTVAAPVMTAILYLLIFGHVLESHVEVYDGVGYTAFLLPGLIMMSVLQNAFANSSSSLIQSKIMGNLVFILLSPLSHRAWFLAYVGSSMVRGMVVGAGVLLATFWTAHLSFAEPLWILTFALLGSALLGALGVIAGLWAEKFDHNAAVTNFVVQPLALLSGTFYVIDNLSPAFQQVSRVNPFFYVISGFRFGFLGQSDIGATNQAVLHGALGLGLLNAVLAYITYRILKSGWKLKG